MRVVITKAELETLEAFIDKVGMRQFLLEVADICGAKADRVRTNWSDGALAQRWDRVGDCLGDLSDTVEKWKL